MTQSNDQTSDFPKIGAPALRALTAAGYHHLEQLTQVSATELLRLHGIGPKAIGLLRQTLAAKGLAFADEQATDKAKGNYAAVNGLKLYYEIHGAGAPLILLHGGLGMIEMLGDLLATLATQRQVVAVDLQGHGRTADIDRPIRYASLGDDIAALIRHLGIAQADVMGYSLGGSVALRTAIQHPELVRKLVVVSTTFRQSGWYPEVVASMRALDASAAEAMKPSPLYQSYGAVAPQPNFPRLLDKMGDLMRQPNDSSKEIPKLPMPVMIVFGDADSISPAHMVEFFGLLGGGQRDAGWDGAGMSKHRLAILPGLTHYDIFASPLLATVVAPFLDAVVSEDR